MGHIFRYLLIIAISVLIQNYAFATPLDSTPPEPQNTAKQGTSVEQQKPQSEDGESDVGDNSDTAETTSALEAATPAENTLDSQEVSQPKKSEASNDVKEHQNGNGFWPFIGLLSLIISIISTAFAVWLFYLRRQLPTGDMETLQLHLMERLDAIEQNFSVVANAYVEVGQNLSDLEIAQKNQVGVINARQSELLEGMRVLATSTAAKDEEIRKLKGGAEKQAIASDLKRFVKVLKMIERDILDDEAHGVNVGSLRSIHQYLEDALLDTGLETFKPEEHTDFRRRNDVEDRYEVLNTEDADLDWKVAGTVSEGYLLNTGNAPLIIEKAKVTIYRYNQKGD